MLPTPSVCYRWQCLHQLLEGLDNVYSVSDGIIVHGADEADIRVKLQNVFQRCEEHVIKLNIQNCQFGFQEISFIGHVSTFDGVKPDSPGVLHKRTLSSGWNGSTYSVLLIPVETTRIQCDARSLGL